MGDIPPLGGLTVNTPPGRPPPPPPADRPALPPDISEIILAEYLARLDVGELCEANLLLICMGLRGTNQCNDPDDPLWKAACARFGLTERLVGGLPGAPATPTWHVTFLAMCKEVGSLTPIYRAAYEGLLRGDDAYEDVNGSLPPHRRPRIAVMRLWYRAAERGLLCMVHSLLRRVDGMDGIVQGDNMPLQLASMNGHLAVVEVLLAHGADVNIGDHHRRALRFASEQGHLAVVEVLLAHGANVHADDDSALRDASYHGHAAVVEVLLAHGADVHASDDAALRNASARGRVAVVEVLLAHGADVHALDDAALQFASRQGRVAVVEVLLAHGADVHADDDAALWFASRSGHPAVVEVLLAHGANVHADDDAALRAASKHGHLAIAELLRAAGATE